MGIMSGEAGCEPSNNKLSIEDSYIQHLEVDEQWLVLDGK